jgi:predicted ATP-dependent serine protease
MVVAGMEGRPPLIEIQALVALTSRHAATLSSVSTNRLSMILAVFEAHGD